MKKTTRKYRKKSKKTKLKLKLGKSWSEKVRSIGKCEFCGGTEFLNAHHHYGKRAESTRWDLDNGVCLCPNCHTFSSVFSAHQTPADFCRWIEKKRGQKWATKLRKKHNRVIKYTTEQLEELLK